MTMSVAADHASMSVHQASYDRLRGALRGAMRAAVESGPGGCLIECRASAALDSLLAAHPVDGEGRCWSCRGPGWLWRRPGVCLVFLEAHYWLRQHTHRVQAHLAAELGVDIAAPLNPADREITEVPPRVEPDLSDPPTDPLPAPAIPPTSTAPAERPELDHGGIGDNPDGLRSRRVPPEHPPPPPQPDRSLLLTGGIT
jgi:hypothetical protein